MEDRALVTFPLLRHVVETANARNVIRTAYDAAEIPQPLSDPGLYRPDNTDMMDSLSTAAVGDSMMLAGGALKLLRQERRPEAEHLATVQRSYGLLKFARIMEQMKTRASTLLGSPYIQISNLRLNGEGEDARVRFQADVIDSLKRLTPVKPGEGCPAARIKGDASGSVLQEEWRRAVEYLLVPDVTLGNYRAQTAEDALYV